MVEHLSWGDDQVIALVLAARVLAALGFLTTAITMAVFIHYNQTPVVKASTRELSYIIFVGMMMSYSSSLAFLAPPSTTSCIAARLLPGLSFSMIYAPLLIKTIRIARIFTGSKKFMVVITLILIFVEVVIIVAMFISEPPGTERQQVRDRLAWVSIYFGSNHKIICMSVCTSLSALVTLILLFFPKIYIIVFRPQLNIRPVTTMEVRVHIGSNKSLGEVDRNVPKKPAGSFKGVATILKAGHLLRHPIMTRLKSALHTPVSGPNAGRLHPDFASSPKAAKTRGALKQEVPERY
ncbi:hypothetical protein HAZT_HAZT005167 [Hyalella azteca]|uniref:G-protein coupled receptors family 3 profile domain-containing protein n=1 Tax=Hyalella azteca TaxID=294128 RepID=A0A6A0GUJ4_HYAAZ|nr:hypothetical protein HAZT_HAZT005167 [Hyalella azteca]